MSRKRAAESSTAAYATAEENKRCRGAIDEMAKAAGRLDTGTEDYPQDFSHDGNPCWPRESRLVGLHSGPTSASPSVRTGQHLGRQTPYVHDALVEHRWSFLAEDDDWLIGFHRYVEKELEKSKHWTCDEEEAAWIMTWVHRLIREPGFSRLRARADRHAERGPRFSILWCAPPFPGTHSFSAPSLSLLTTPPPYVLAVMLQRSASPWRGWRTFSSAVRSPSYFAPTQIRSLCRHHRLHSSQSNQ